MDVTRYNLDDGLLLLERSLTDPKCEFVAFDEEMTGIAFGNASFRDFNAARDSPAARYAKMRGVARSFGVVQVGVSAFVRSEDGSALRARCFNVYLLPGEHAKRDINLSGGAVKFLSDHGMDWAKWLDEGAPYCDRHDEAELAAAAAADPAARRAADGRGTITLTSKTFKEFADAQLAKVAASVGINRRSTAGPGYLRTPLSRSNRTRFH